ncbi:hypothetical protein SAMN04244570_1773 [Sporosarcina newyorkensis]|uniref:Uncharacterized protein n=1 Tax=Sporosarcina newyorkensis TaxID=759851 RepID=A0A1T4Y318_9BACL|nr:hypothetical protein SAMN04244570_1773 [Sporosarcina newyorkensis]
MTRFLVFLFSYSIIVICVANLLFYLNYAALGYDYKQITLFMLQSTDFTMLVIAIISLVFTVCVPSPSRPPSS